MSSLAPGYADHSAASPGSATLPPPAPHMHHNLIPASSSRRMGPSPILEEAAAEGAAAGGPAEALLSHLAGAIHRLADVVQVRASRLCCYF